MRLDKLLADAGTLRKTVELLEAMDEIEKRNPQNNIHVHAYVVRAHWRKRHFSLRLVKRA